MAHGHEGISRCESLTSEAKHRGLWSGDGVTEKVVLEATVQEGFGQVAMGVLGRELSVEGLPGAKA